MVSKEGHADSVLGHKMTPHYSFPRKRYNCKHCFLFPIPDAKSILLIALLSYDFHLLRTEKEHSLSTISRCKMHEFC